MSALLHDCAHVNRFADIYLQCYSHVAMVDEIVKSQGRLQETVDREPDKTFSDYQSETFQNAKVTSTA